MLNMGEKPKCRMNTEVVAEGNWSKGRPAKAGKGVKEVVGLKTLLFHDAEKQQLIEDTRSFNEALHRRREKN